MFDKSSYVRQLLCVPTLAKNIDNEIGVVIKVKLKKRVIDVELQLPLLLLPLRPEHLNQIQKDVFSHKENIYSLKSL